MAIIEGRGVTKYYNSLLAVDNVDFSIDDAECFGFLGPNGAGKTTIMKMILLPHTGQPPATSRSTGSA